MAPTTNEPNGPRLNGRPAYVWGGDNVDAALDELDLRSQLTLRRVADAVADPAATTQAQLGAALSSGLLVDLVNDLAQLVDLASCAPRDLRNAAGNAEAIMRLWPRVATDADGLPSHIARFVDAVRAAHGEVAA